MLTSPGRASMRPSTGTSRRAYSPDGEGFWVMSRHEDAMAVMLDPVTFSSDKGGESHGRRHRAA